MDDPHLKRTKSANEAAEPGVGRFSKLPNELLQRIFALAYAKTKPSQPLSRRLRPFYDEIVFRKIKADSSSRIRTLQTCLAGRPGLGAHIRDLVVQEPGDQACLSLDEIKTVFACLSNLQALSLRVDDPNWLEATLPDGPDAQTALPVSTVSLTMVASTKQRGDAYDPVRLGALAQLPSLTQLGLDFRSKYKAPEGSSATASASDLILPNVTNLSVGLPKVPSSVNAFIGCFPHVRKLTLTSHADAPDFATALASIKSPAEVVELTIRASPKAGWRFPDELAAFSSLDSLVLAGQFQHLESDAYKALGHTPITTLAVGKKSDISATALTALLGEKGLCPTIKTMRLDNLSATAPRSAARDVLDLMDMDGNPWTILDKFLLPHWTAAFTDVDSLQLQQATKDAGVKLKGTIVEALRVQREYDRLEDRVFVWDN
ncbi:hypothetical protein JCM8115_005753 [Rhodotorula mucilaginosa]